MASVLDISVLSELSGGDEELAASILSDYMSSTEADLRELSVAFAAADAELVLRYAHRTKGASLAVGAHDAAELAQRLEQQAGEQEWPVLDELRQTQVRAVALVGETLAQA